jgi:hypothetical protein
MGSRASSKAVHGGGRGGGAEPQDRGGGAEDLPSDRAAASRCCATRRGGSCCFCDDLSFSHDDAHYKSLKAVLDGGIEGRPRTFVLYATSNGGT